MNTTKEKKETIVCPYLEGDSWDCQECGHVMDEHYDFNKCPSVLRAMRNYGNHY